MDINPIRLVTLAKEASEAFLKNGQDLNEAIAKLAEQNELNPMQIRRVAEYANHEVQGALYKDAQDKSFTFEVANPEKIIGTLQRPEEQTKIASAQMVEAAYSRTPQRRETVKLAAERFINRIDDHQRELSLCQHGLNKLAQHIQHFTRELHLQQMVAQSEIEESMDKIAKMAKDHIIMNNGLLSDLFKFACIKDPELSNDWKIVFEHIKGDLMKFGAPVDRALINDKLEVPDGTLEVINGSHTLAIDLDTLKNKVSDEDRLAMKLRLMDTFGDAVVDKIRVLRTPEDMDESILEDVTWLNKKAEEGLDAFIDVLEKESGWKVPAALIGIPAGAGLLYGGYKMLQGGSREASKELHRSFNMRKRMEELARGE